MNRGRKPTPCPNSDELRRLHAEGFGPIEIGRRIGGGHKAIIRWLGELGIAYEVKKVRPRGVTPAYVKVAYLSSGKRHWVRLYGVWNAMRGRCNCPGIKDYPRYGARGIRVCEEWNDYDVFRAWAIQTGYRKHLTLDRIDVNGDYEPTNCEWIPKGEQQLNTRRTHVITANGETKTLMEWAKVCGITADQIRARIQHGWSGEHAVTIPIGSLPRGRGRGLKTFLFSEGTGS
jgi:hypothetical protein